MVVYTVSNQYSAQFREMKKETFFLLFSLEFSLTHGGLLGLLGTVFTPARRSRRNTTLKPKMSV